MPAQPTAVERLARWAALVSIHPESGHFDARRFVQDMVNRNILFTLHMVSRTLPTAVMELCCRFPTSAQVWGVSTFVTW
jgi:hypothetical protein